MPASLAIAYGALVGSSGPVNTASGFIGGVPCFGYDAILVVDPKVFEKEFVYTGGGSEFALVRISTKEILKTRNPIIKKITGKKSN